MIITKRLSEGQRQLLTDSLRIAMGLFTNDARAARETDPRIAEAFDQQYNDARELMQRIEQCESISISEGV